MSAGVSGRSRRGSVYVLVLGVSMLVVTIGAGAALGARADLERRSVAADLAQAESAAGGVISVVIQAMNEREIDVRTVEENRWILKSSRGRLEIEVRFSDPDDGSLSNDANGRVRIESRAVVGRVSQYRSLIVQPRLETGDIRPSKWGVVPGTYRIEPAS